MTKRIRGGMGFGDALYLQAVVRYLVSRGENLEVCTKWPQLFKHLPVKISPFDRNRINILAHYTLRKSIQETTQFQDVCINAGVPKDIELKLDWQIHNQANKRFLDPVKPLVCVQMARAPMSRVDGIGKELLPDCNNIQKLINALSDIATVLVIGEGKPLFQFRNVIDLTNKTSLEDVLDIASVADMFIGYPSSIIPLAESFGKGGLYFWSRAVHLARQNYIRNITPKKLMHGPGSVSVYDHQFSQTNIDRFIERLLQTKQKAA